MSTDTVTRWATAITHGDSAALSELMSDEIVLHSPLTNAFVFRGPGAVAAVFDAAFELLCDLAAHTLLADVSSGVVVYSGTVAGQPMEEMHLLRFSAEGKVVDVTLMGRPVPALLEVMAAIPAGLARRGVMTPAAARAALGIRPVAILLNAVDKRLLPRLPPSELPCR